MKIKKVLVSQPKPASDKSPYFDIAEKYGVEIVFRPFIKVEGVSAKEFRQQKVSILDHTAVVFTSRHAIDHFFTLCQALRIEVNHEMESLKEMLEQCKEMLKPGGRLVVITYHSIEDRIVKNFIKSGNIEGKIEKDFFGRSTSPFDVSKMMTPTDEELERNPRSRSAKLRVATKREE